jgi:hypothetical protein
MLRELMLLYTNGQVQGASSLAGLSHGVRG